MPKYSTGGSARGGPSGDATACELCGNESSSLQDANIAGAQLSVCSECSPHNDSDTSSDDGENGRDDEAESDRKRKAIQNAAQHSDYLNKDTSRWENEGANYNDDQLPYLMEGYAETLQTARREVNLTHDELAEEIGATGQDIELMESGQIRSTSIGGSTIAALEQFLGIQLSDPQ